MRLKKYLKYFNNLKKIKLLVKIDPDIFIFLNFVSFRLSFLTSNSC